MAGEQRILSGKGNRPDEILDSIAVHLDAAVGEEEPEPVAEGLDQRREPRLSFGDPALGRAAADLGLDGVELGDPAQALGGDLRAAAVADFAEPAPTMCPASDRVSPGKGDDMN